MGVTFLISTAVSAIVSGIDNMIHATEKAIEAG
jgi:hypothetical protein